MNIRRLSYPLLFALAAPLVVACGGPELPPEAPPPAPPPAAPPAAPTPETPAPAAAAPEAAKPKEEAPAPKPLKEKLVGTWQLDYSGDVKTAAEASAQKKAGKDEKKLADLLKKAEEDTAKEKVEHTADTVTLFHGDKAVSKAKYEIVKEEGNVLTVKRVGKDEITKKDAPAAELVITFKDDSTIELRDPAEKDQKKAKLLVFKKSTAAAGTSAAPASSAGASGSAGAAAGSAGTAGSAGAAGSAGSAAGTTAKATDTGAAPPAKK